LTTRARIFRNWILDDLGPVLHGLWLLVKLGETCWTEVEGFGEKRDKGVGEKLNLVKVGREDLTESRNG
jgi:hypothetical protein